MVICVDMQILLEQACRRRRAVSNATTVRPRRKPARPAIPPGRTGSCSTSPPTLVDRTALAGGVPWVGHTDLSFIDAHGTAAAANDAQCGLVMTRCFVRMSRGRHPPAATAPAQLRPRPRHRRAHHGQRLHLVPSAAKRLSGRQERLGVGPRDGSFGPPTSATFHPPGWAGAPGQPQGHAAQARMNLRACVSCHSRHLSRLPRHHRGERAGAGREPSWDGLRGQREVRAVGFHEPPRVSALSCTRGGGSELHTERVTAAPSLRRLRTQKW